jgi:hypothetical protein
MASWGKRLLVNFEAVGLCPALAAQPAEQGME